MYCRVNSIFPKCTVNMLNITFTKYIRFCTENVGTALAAVRGRTMYSLDKGNVGLPTKGLPFSQKTPLQPKITERSRPFPTNNRRRTLRILTILYKQLSPLKGKHCFSKMQCKYAEYNIYKIYTFLH